jgi:hypothetical protein
MAGAIPGRTPPATVRSVMRKVLAIGVLAAAVVMARAHTAHA